MHCTNFESRLQFLLDERQRPETDDRLQQHAGQCPACQELLDGQQLLFDAMDAISIPTLESSVYTNISPELEHLADASPSPTVASIHSPRWLATGVATAATVMIALWLVLPDQQAVTDPQDKTKQISQLPEDTKPADVVEDQLQLPPSISEFLFIDLDQPEITYPLMLAVPSIHLAGLPLSNAPLRRQVENWWRLQTGEERPVDRIRDDLRPLAAPISSVFDAIWESLKFSHGKEMGDIRPAMPGQWLSGWENDRIRNLTA